VTYCNSISVSEHIVMMILALVRNYIPSYGWVVRGGWNIADCVERSYDLEGMNVGTVAPGRIGLAALRRLKPFGVKLHYYDKHRLPKEVEHELDLTSIPTSSPWSRSAMSSPSTPRSIRDRTPLQRQAHRHDEARQLHREHGARQDLRPRRRRSRAGKRTARRLCRDVWFPQPPAKDHPWRKMPHHGMTPHISGSSLSAQTRYAAARARSSRTISPASDPYRVFGRRQGKLAGVGAHSYTAGDATKGSRKRRSSKSSRDDTRGFVLWKE